MGLLTPLAKERGYSSAQARGAAKKVALTVWAGVGVPGSYGHLFEAEAMERHSGGGGELQIPAQCLGGLGVWMDEEESLRKEEIQDAIPILSSAEESDPC